MYVHVHLGTTIGNEKRDNKQCLLDIPAGKQSIIKDSYQNKICIYIYKAIALFRITKGSYSNSIGP